MENDIPLPTGAALTGGSVSTLVDTSSDAIRVYTSLREFLNSAPSPSLLPHEYAHAQKLSSRFPNYNYIATLSVSVD